MKTKQESYSSSVTTNLSAELMFSRTRRYLAGALSILLLTFCAPFTSADYYYPAATYVRIADKVVRLLDAPMTMKQRQVRNALTFNELPASERPLYLYALSFYESFKIASDGQSLSDVALAANLPSPAGLLDEGSLHTGIFCLEAPARLLDETMVDVFVRERTTAVLSGEVDPVAELLNEILSTEELPANMAAIVTEAETYVERLCVLFADELTTTPFEDALFLGYLTGAATGLNQISGPDISFLSY